MFSLRPTIDVLVYLSVMLGVVLLYQLYCSAPRWLFITVLAGWLAYLAVAALVAAGNRLAYPLALVLSILTLGASLPSPEHLAFRTGRRLFGFDYFPPRLGASNSASHLDSNLPASQETPCALRAGANSSGLRPQIGIHLGRRVRQPELGSVP